MAIEEQIENAGALTAVFGEWPSFHDAEIVRMHLERGPDQPYLEAAIHVFRMTKEIDDHGFYVLTNHTLVTIRFIGIVLYELKWFNHQNAIDGLEIWPAEDGEGKFSVEFPSNNGCDARFNCDAIAVLSVAPFEPAAQQAALSGVTMQPGRPV